MPRSQPGLTVSNDAVQALSLYFQLLNVTEAHVAWRTRRRREQHLGADAEPGRWGYFFKKLAENGIRPDEIRSSMADTCVESVFTKHPTEAKRWSVLRIHREIGNMLRERENAITAQEQQECFHRACMLLERLWLTSEIFDKKPEVEDELNNLLFYLTEVFPELHRIIDAQLKGAWHTTWPDQPRLTIDSLPQLRFGSWVGGDRDGHPLVTAEVTRMALSRYRSAALKVVRDALQSLASSLSFTVGQAPLPEQFKDSVHANAPEPWKALVLDLSTKLETFRPADLEARLKSLSDAVSNLGAQHFVEAEIDPVRRLLQNTGFHLVRLDIRQNSDFYHCAVQQLMQAACHPDADVYSSWDETQRIGFYEYELRQARPFSHRTMELPREAREVCDTFEVVRETIDKYGKDGLGSLIVSMTRSLDDLLAVYILGRETGLTRMGPNGLFCELPVVPLFETFEDLTRAPAIMNAFLAHPVTRASLPQVNGRPATMVMLGYSDSNKDTGIIASQWALQVAQSELIKVADCHGVTITFFHGRGGTIGRGAGPTHRFLEALPPRALEGGLRITEQGEVIAQKYNLTSTASANLHWLVAGTVGSKLLGSRRSQAKGLDEAMDGLATASRRAYRRLIDHPQFLEFYRTATPIDAIERSRIGSRPSRRTGQATLNDLRAIPWVFSWNQSRFYVPGWFGVGSALESIEEMSPANYSLLKNNVESSPFLRYLFYNVESSLMSSDIKWMQAYAELVPDEAVRSDVLQLILDERERTCTHLNALFDGPVEQRRPRLLATMRMRQEQLNVLHAEQIRLLREMRSRSIPDEAVVESLLLTLSAIASGLRTTG